MNPKASLSTALLRSLPPALHTDARRLGRGLPGSPDAFFHLPQHCRGQTPDSTNTSAGIQEPPTPGPVNPIACLPLPSPCTPRAQHLPDLPGLSVSHLCAFAQVSPSTYGGPSFLSLTWLTGARRHVRVSSPVTHSLMSPSRTEFFPLGAPDRNGVHTV